MITIDEAVKALAEKSVLCWLATANEAGAPNVSPKEAFTIYQNRFLIANIASPKSLKNMQANQQVCLAFLEVFTQKGFQVHGHAQVVDEQHHEFESLKAPLLALTEGRFPFSSITAITPTRIHPIVAPSYYLFKDTTEQDQATQAFQQYSAIYKDLFA